MIDKKNDVSAPSDDFDEMESDDWKKLAELRTSLELTTRLPFTVFQFAITRLKRLESEQAARAAAPVSGQGASELRDIVQDIISESQGHHEGEWAYNCKSWAKLETLFDSRPRSEDGCAKVDATGMRVVETIDDEGRSSFHNEYPLSDADIEGRVKACGGRWDGNVWAIEDADLHPMIRSFASTTPPKADNE